MAKKIFKADIVDSLPLGGIGTGYINLGADGSIAAPFLSLFMIKAEKDGQLFDARLLNASGREEHGLSCFERSSAKAFFPFVEISLTDSSFPADVSLTAFSPFIPLNATDSGIPAVMLEFEVKNKLDERIDFSICSVMQNKSGNAFNRMGCTDTGEAYILLSENSEHPENTCIATNGKNISFCEYSSSIDEIADNFTKNLTLTNNTRLEGALSGSFGALCTHFSLDAGKSQGICFCLSWYKPENEFSRNYYAQYFESSLECASYFFRQKERLYGSSMEFCENILGATLTDGVLLEIGNDLFSLIKSETVRLADGTVRTSLRENFCDMESFFNEGSHLTNLFPELEYSEILDFYKSCRYEAADENETALAILRSYRRYILSSDEDALIEDWYYIVKCAEKLFGENMSAVPRLDEYLQSAVIEALAAMAAAVKDKKRYEIYNLSLDSLPLSQFSMCIARGFARLNELSGFVYNAVTRHIGFNPSSDSCPLDDGNTFRCFFCTPDGYGYVEEGIDYIEINLLCGSLTVRSFGVPRTPRLVRYGGRNWRFENNNLTAVLDSELEVTPQKKLTIFIDIKQ